MRSKILTSHVFGVPDDMPECLGEPTWIEAFHAISGAYDRLASDRGALAWVVEFSEGARQKRAAFYLTRAAWCFSCKDSEQFRLFVEAFPLPTLSELTEGGVMPDGCVAADRRNDQHERRH